VGDSAATAKETMPAAPSARLSAKSRTPLTQPGGPIPRLTDSTEIWSCAGSLA
jgi:hypothetical protein